MDKRTILKMIEFSALSYCNCQPNLQEDEIIFINTYKCDVQCYIRKQGNTILITFRGSDSWHDVLGNLRFWRKKIPYGNYRSKIRVHSGFINAYKCDNVRETIQSKIVSGIKQVQITGHSLGAALAVLCAADLQYNYPDIDYEVFLFGCPRVGNRAFQKSYNKRIFKTFRVENGNDIITKLPYSFLGYRHVGIRMHVGVPRVFGAISWREHGLRSYYSYTWKEPAT